MWASYVSFVLESSFVSLYHGIIPHCMGVTLSVEEANRKMQLSVQFQIYNGTEKAKLTEPVKRRVAARSSRVT